MPTLDEKIAALGPEYISKGVVFKRRDESTEPTAVPFVSIWEINVFEAIGDTAEEKTLSFFVFKKDVEGEELAFFPNAREEGPKTKGAIKAKYAGHKAYILAEFVGIKRIYDESYNKDTDVYTAKAKYDNSGTIENKEFSVWQTGSGPDTFEHSGT